VLFIDGAYGAGQRAVITRSSGYYRFYVNTSGDTLTIQNATIKGGTTAAGVLGDYGAIYIIENATLNLDNTTFSENAAYAQHGSAISLSASGKTVTANGKIEFIDNVGVTGAGGAVGVDLSSTLTFTGETTFERNSTEYYGGAVAAYASGTIVFKEKAIFRNNHVTTYFGGAIDIWSGTATVKFEGDVEFTGNYAKNTSLTSQSFGVRGGAVNVGYITGSAPPQFIVEGTATFAGNYVWGMNTTAGLGGALSLSSQDNLALTEAPQTSRQYAAEITQGIFTNNIAYSASGNAYGGAVFAKVLNAELTLGDGSSFTNNYAKTQGGAIYFDQGILNLNGNVTFGGNRHGASFDTTTGEPVYVGATGTPNAIFFGVSSNTATLNLNTPVLTQQIQFSDPITATTGKTVTVNKTGPGAVTFSDYDSNFLAKTTVSGGTFELLTGAAYGLKGTAGDGSFFTLAKDATLHGGAESVLRAWQLTLNGNVNIDAGTFTVDTGSAVTFGADSVLTVTITNTETFSQILLTSAVGLVLTNGASLEINAAGYVPSSDLSDFFSIISSISTPVTGKFAQEDSITINGAEFLIDYNGGDITLRQVTAPEVPEPTTYALLTGLGLLIVGLRRRRCRRIR
ncbi:MAG: PEP-CTERM sorting domain-containing protein, partial [Puniceicoccales bacterium]|jgi:predicted outer membrane repeat protein|nr:PEP-CTERM sorting domain-containing protein [Puniceicoccales bacterium]